MTRGTTGEAVIVRTLALDHVLWSSRGSARAGLGQWNFSSVPGDKAKAYRQLGSICGTVRGEFPFLGKKVVWDF